MLTFKQLFIFGIFVFMRITGKYLITGLLVAVGIMTIASCRKKPDPVTNTPAVDGSLKMEFSNVVGENGLVLNTQSYVNAAGDTFYVSAYRYYISNIILNRTNGQSYAEPNSYHLLDQEDLASRKIRLENVPGGEYSSVTFTIGVDSTKNVNGANTGAIDPGNGMHWTWNTGYIMAKLEGIANTSAAPRKAFTFHIGGYSGPYNALKTITLPFPEKAVVSASNIPNVHVFSNVLEWFKTPTTISFRDMNEIMSIGPESRKIADNYADMFVVDHVDN